MIWYAHIYKYNTLVTHIYKYNALIPFFSLSVSVPHAPNLPPPPLPLPWGGGGGGIAPPLASAFPLLFRVAVSGCSGWFKAAPPLQRVCTWTVFAAAKLYSS